MSEAVERSAPLQSGVERASVRVLAGKTRINHQARRVRRASPNLFNSGFFVLSELDGANPDAREAFRKTSLVAPACVGRVAGFGGASYILALTGLLDRLQGA
jgi:hypothetical protein